MLRTLPGPFILVAIAFSVPSFCAVTVDLNGKWSVFNANKTIHVSGSVPGNVYSALHAAQIIDDPLKGFNDVSTLWIALDNWSYQLKFKVPKNILLYKHIDLIFYGLDTIADVYLNSQLIGKTRNMFRTFRFDVKSHVQERNVLLVQFVSAVNFGRRAALHYPYVVPPECPVSAQHGQCHVNFIRKQACSFSWDWGPALPSAGIWKSVKLEAYHELAVSSLAVVPLQVSGSWIVNVSLHFTEVMPVGMPILYSLHIEGLLNYTETIRDLQEAFLVRLVKLQQQANIQLWWPNGFGNQSLYTVVLNVTAGGMTVGASRRIGFRTIHLIQEKVNNSEGLSFFFRVNGLAIFARGSNWVPARIFPDQASDLDVQHLLASVHAAGMNMLRVWGGGVYESDEFYSLADEYGIMIWQDLMFACSMYPTDKYFLQQISAEVRQQIRHLASHPSIAVYAGNNENEVALRQNWYATASEYGRYYADYVTLYVTTIAPIVASEDASRAFLTSSPSNGWASAKQGWVAKDPQSAFYGDVHFYDYSHDLWSPSVFPSPRFVSEYGVQSWPSLLTLLPILPSQSLHINSSFCRHRQHHPHGESQLLAAISLHWTLNATKIFTNFSHYIYLTQINQAMSIKAETEHYRRLQGQIVNGQGHTMGALYWQLNDVWQAPSWSSIEFGGRWKMLHYFSRHFFSSVLISLIRTRSDSLQVFLSKDFHQNRNLTLSLFIRQWDNFVVLHSEYISFYEGLSHNSLIFSRPLKSLLAGRCQSASECFVECQLTYRSQLLSSNWLSFEPNFNKIPNLRKSILKVERVVFLNSHEVLVSLVTDYPALFVWIEVSKAVGWFSDNGFLMSQQSYNVTFLSRQSLNLKAFEQSLSVKSMTDSFI